MALFEKKQNLSQGGMKRKLEKMPASRKEDLSIFGRKPFIRRENLRSWARSDQAFRTTNLAKEERLKIVQELFKGKDFWKKVDAEKVLKKLKTERYFARKEAQRREIDKKIKIVKGVLGKK